MKYDAFISYRHTEIDFYIAKRLHKGLETFKVPRAIAKKSGKKNIRRVFRDQEELPIGSDLGDNIESALRESEFLLVICSPRTPESYWVQKEISTFIQMHDREHVLAILVEGEPDEAFPKQLLEDENGNPVEPLAADVRGKNKTEIHRKLKTEIIRLAAPLLYCSYDDLRQRHRERCMKKAAVLSAVIAMLAVSFGVYSTYNAELIRHNLEGKQRNQSKFLADMSLSLYKEGDRKAAALVALEALPSKENDRPYVAEAQYALSEALRCYDTGNVIGMDRNLHHDLPVKDFHFNEDGTKLLSIDQGDNIYVWNMENGEMLVKIPPQIDEYGYIVTPVDAAVYEEHILICDFSGVYSLTFDGREEWRAEGDSGFVYCKFDEASKLAACVSNREVSFFDITDGRKCYTMPNHLEDSYSAAMAFNEDRTKFAISHLGLGDEETVTGCISVFDLKTQTVMDIDTVPTYIADVVFTTDGCLVAAGMDGDDLKDMDQTTKVGCVEKIDIENGDLLWCKEFAYQTVGFHSASIQLKSRSYLDDQMGEVHDEVLMSVDNTAYTWDSVSGEQIARIEVGNGILSFLVSAGGGLGYLGESNGTIDIVDMTTGTNYSSAAIDTGKVLKDMAVRNGAIVVRAYESPFLTVMKYHKGTDMVEVKSYENSVQCVDYSPKEIYYAVGVYGDEFQYEIYFFQSNDNTCVGQWLVKDSYIVTSEFISDEEYVIVDSDGKVTFYHVLSGETDELEAGDDFKFGNCDKNKENSLMMLYSGRRYCVIDLRKKEMLSEGEVENKIYGAILSGDGQKIYCSLGQNGVYIIEVSTGELQLIETEGYQILNGGETQEALALNEDGTLLAVSCQDGMLRVLDLKEMETVVEIPFAGRNRRFIEFSKDDTELLLQGDDYYFRVFDLKKKEFSYISTDQYYQIEDFVADEVSGTVSLVTTSDLIILNIEDYERVAQIDGGRAYLPLSGKILCSYNRTLYQFPYMTLEMLKEETKRQFGDAELSEEERVRYHVD